MAEHSLPKRFHAFILTQGLGAFNDNVFKMLLQLFVVLQLTEAESKSIIATANLVFTVPFMLFGPWSGYFADKHAKHILMRKIKFFEIGVMALGVVAFFSGNIWFLLFILFLMATQSTFFSPAKYGYVPEICDPESITKANSWIEMTTFVSVIFGTAIVGPLLSVFDNNAFYVAFFCIGFAVIGTLTSFRMPVTTAKGAEESFPWNPLTGIVRDLNFLRRRKGVWLASLANSYFWQLGLIFSTNIVLYGKNQIGLGEDQAILISLLPAFLGVGIGSGSMLASRWSGQKVELGLVPLGGMGMALGGIALFFTTSSYVVSAIILTVAGVAGGLFIVPLYAYLQFVAGEHEKGRVMASAGILNGIFLVMGSGVYWLLAVFLDLSADDIYLIIGLLTIGAVIYICTVIPEYFIRFCFWLLTHTFYKIRINGAENVPLKGPALLAPNHASYADAFLIGATIQRFVRFIMIKDFYDVPGVRWFFKIMDAIPIAPKEGRASVAKSLATARAKLAEGHVVCIFPEGGITRDGELQEFRSGLETVMEGQTAPIIPIYMENVWGSIFSFEGGKVLWKWPKRIPYPVTITYGEPLPPSSKAAEVEAAVKRLAAQEADKQKTE